MQRILDVTVWFLLASTLQAQIAYNAGNAGNPPQAPSPTTQGWAESITGSCVVTDVSPDPDAPLNAWQIHDPGPGRVLYSLPFAPGNADYQAEVVMRPVAEESYLEIDAGENIMDNVFWIALRLVGQDVHVVELSSGNTLVCPGAAGEYHSYRFVSGYGWDDAQVYFDGAYLGLIPYSSWGLGSQGSGLRWGTRDSASGRFRVNRVWMGFDEPCSFKTAVYCTAKVNSQGCTPTISWTGSPSASHATSFRIWGSNVMNNSFGMLIYSKIGADAKPFQGGLLCLATPFLRTSLLDSGGNPPPADCSGNLVFEFNDYVASGADPGLVLGKDVWTQYWYRDSGSPSGTGLTDALYFILCP